MSFYIKNNLPAHAISACESDKVFQLFPSPINQPLNENQLKMAECLLKRDAHASNTWHLYKDSMAKAIENQDVPLVKLLATFDRTLVHFPMLEFLLDQNEQVFFETILESVDTLMQKFYIEKALSGAIKNTNIQRIEYLASLKCTQQILKEKDCCYLFENALNTGNTPLIRTLIDVANQIPFLYLRALALGGYRDFFDQAIKKATWDPPLLKKSREHAARIKVENPAYYSEIAYFVEQVERFFGPTELNLRLD